MAAAMEQELCGPYWTLRCLDSSSTSELPLPESIPAVVPGCVHLDLQNAGLIEDVFWRDNEKGLEWVAARDWEYEREFELDTSFSECDKVVLTCEGLDTFATVRINGHPVISADNMFRTWTADVKHLLNFPASPEKTSSAKNTIMVAFKSTLPFMTEKQKERKLWAGNAAKEEYQGQGWVRKEPASFGWDWGCAAPTAGIWRPIKFQGFKTAWLESIHIVHEDISAAGVETGPNGTVTYKPPDHLDVFLNVEFASLGEKALDDTNLTLDVERVGGADGGVKVHSEVLEPGAFSEGETNFRETAGGTERDDGSAHVSASAKTGGAMTSEGRLTPGDTASAIADSNAVRVTQGRVRITFAKPELWWPNGTGLTQTLYRVTATLIRKSTAEVLSCQEKTIGLRTVKLVREKDEWGESFGFSMNGVKIFAKGANWIPADIYLPRITPEKYRALLKSAADAGMNMVRAWGGGVYEAPAFYDACDELGLLVWQDFQFACSTYPVHDSAWLANVEREAIEIVRLLRHRACLALWCGNNELEQMTVGDTWTDRTMPWDQYKRLFDDVLRKAVERYDGRTSYWPSSPHTPVGGDEGRRNPNDARSGDAHCWDVWHGGDPFEVQRNWHHRFVSEFGFQSFPEPRTVAGYTLPEDRNVSSYVMDFHQRSVGRGNRAIFENLLEWFQMPRDFPECLWMSQLTQALCIQFAVEHLRRQQPQTEGVLYWQLNDEWPAPTWSSLDHLGRWKALHYFARRFFARVLITGLEDTDRGTVQVHLSNHELIPVSGEVTWRLTDAAGTELDTGSKTVHDAPSQANSLITTLDFSEALTKNGARDILVWLKWTDRRGALPQSHVAEEKSSYVSRNLVLFARPKHLNFLKNPNLTVQAKANASDGSLLLSLRSQHPALWVRLEIGETELPAANGNGLQASGSSARGDPPGASDTTCADQRRPGSSRTEDQVWFEDNFVHLDGREPVMVVCRSKLGAEAVRAALKLTAVKMTWDP